MSWCRFSTLALVTSWTTASRSDRFVEAGIVSCGWRS